MPTSALRFVALALAGLLGCHGDPAPAAGAAGIESPAPRAGTATLKESAPFRAAWTWISAAPGTATVVATLTPTTNCRKLVANARPDQGVTHVGGPAQQIIEGPTAGTAIPLTFEISFDPQLESPQLLLDVQVEINDGHTSATTIVLHDPAAPPAPVAEGEGERGNLAGRPTKVIGEMTRK